MSARLSYLFFILSILISACGGGGGSGNGAGPVNNEEDPGPQSTQTPFYFTGNDGSVGAELYRTNGSSDTTELVKDIIQNDSSNPSLFVELGNRVLFQADDGVHGNELWVREADGNVHLLMDIVDGEGGNYIRASAIMGGYFYFMSSNQLWRTDGTSINTSLVSTLSGVSTVDSIAVLGNRLIIFTRTYNPISHDLWSSDGTTQNTNYITNLNTTHITRTYQIVEYNGFLYFNRYSTVNGSELWRTDGTIPNTGLVNELNTGNSGSYIGNIVTLGSNFYFTVSAANSPVELWRSNGTTTSREIVDSGINSNLMVMNSLIYYAANNDELYSYNGTTSTLVRDIIPGINDSLQAKISWMREIEGRMWLSVFTEAEGSELWVANNALTDISLVKDITPGNGSTFANYMSGYQGNVYFTVYAGVNGRKELWVTDGTEINTMELPGTSPVNSNVTVLVSGQNGLYYRSYSPDTGAEPWMSDGSETGASLIADINQVNGGSSPWIRDQSTGRLIFTARDPDVGRDSLWISDGTDVGTEVLSRAPANGGGINKVLAGNELTYYVSLGGSNYNLWRVNNTTKETILIDSNPSSNGGIRVFHLVGDKLFYAINNNGTYEHKVSDGSVNGTYVITDTTGQSVTGNGSEFSSFGNFAYFTASRAVNSTVVQTLWKTDGGVDNAVPIFDFSSDLYPVFIEGADNQLILAMSNSNSSNIEFWVSSGEIDTTTLVKSVSMTIDDFEGYKTRVGSRIFFRANTPEAGDELWVSDGTVNGTRLVKDINPGTQGSFPGDLTALGDNVVFAVSDENDDSTLWISNGLENGTYGLLPQGVSTVGKNVSSLTSHEDFVFFDMGNRNDGYELWMTNGRPLGTKMVTNIVSGI